MTKRPYPPELKANIEALLAAAEEAKQKGMADFTEPRFTLAAITAGLGIPEATVRNWLTRNQIDLGASEGRQRGKWRLFSTRDVLVIATCYHLSRLGVPVSVFSMVYSKVVGLARMYFSGPVGMVQHPIGLLYNDGEWRLERTFDSGPMRVTDGTSPPICIMIDFEKIILSTLNSLGLNVGFVRASDVVGEGGRDGNDASI
ncbi:hypothetical protein HL658_16855 [Azospirillum sp. RWY-5-1]|uniref:HTH merR-type domain-containing protein n=1 Tax=Azospirillum oleiclasticum TaxID=2735135 RepID=A0ABX2TET3_9PROT|nr:hypothetical protein [Azospirillum oleiclasticum]NYZ14228.1 hypothetical protein [Azospirillum oleiclasticum]NYZ21712.1 hypothetical protein [Azospirillum oleiclasticum]